VKRDYRVKAPYLREDPSEFLEYAGCDGIRASGSPLTSMGNTIINAIMLHDSFVSMRDTSIASITGRFEDFGFNAKVKVFDAVEEADFCSGAFARYRNGIMFVPKLGRFLGKLGVCTARRTGRALSEAVKAGYYSYAQAMRPFGLRIGRVLSTWAGTTEAVRDPYKVMHGASDELTNDERAAFFVARYGVDLVEPLEQLGALLGAARMRTDNRYGRVPETFEVAAHNLGLERLFEIDCA